MKKCTQYTPLTAEEGVFVAENHYLVDQYLRQKKLERNEWYDVVIFRFLLSVKRWFSLPELHQWSFATIAYNAMRSAVWNERQKQNRRIQTISLDETVPGTEDMKWMDTITEENLNFVIYVEEDMNISYDVIIPERKRWNGGKKSDEVIAVESFLQTKKMKNMRIEYEELQEAKKKLSALNAWKRKKQLEAIEIFRIDNNLYIVRKEEKDGKH